MTSTLADLDKEGLIFIRTGPFGSALHAHEYRDSGVSVIPTEAIQGGRISHDRLMFISEEKACELDRYRVHPGDIPFARRGVRACGFSALVTSDVQNAIAGTGVIVLSIRDRAK